MVRSVFLARTVKAPSVESEEGRLEKTDAAVIGKLPRQSSSG